tara:strand:+ start:4453 stop:6126 length:1674 start_codon:yes stop_codon:yes gene_type:complete
MNFFILVSYYFVFFVSISGYGLFFVKFLKLNLNKNEYSLIGIFGLIFLTFISFISNIFVAHNFIHNIILHSFGIFFFIKFFRDFFPKISVSKKYFYSSLIFIFIFFTLNLMAKTHDDFGWYHLPYTLNLAQQKLQFGLGHFNHGFRTHSSIFYINSLFYLPYIKFYSFNFGQQFIFLFSILFFFQKIFEKKKTINSIQVFSVLSLLFSLIIFYRLAEHGTDRSGQILIFILVILIIEFLNEKMDLKKIPLILIILSFVFTLKSYFIIFGILIFPIILKLKLDFKKYKDLIASYSFIFIFLLIALNFSVQMANTGCFLYPINLSCFSQFEWSFNSKKVQEMNVWYELWSKAGANPNWRIENIDEYLTGFNWVNNWISNYFFNKVSDFLGGLFLILLVTYSIIKKNLFLSNKTNQNYLKIFLCFVVLFLIWFYKFPQLRYGGFVIVANLLFISFCFFISSFLFKKKITKSFKILIILGLMIYSGRNIDRLLNEKYVYEYNIFGNTFFKIENYDYNTKKLDENLYLNIVQKGSCWNIPQPCTHRSSVKGRKWKNYIVYYE